MAVDFVGILRAAARGVMIVTPAIGAAQGIEEIAFQMLRRLALDLGPSVSVAFYQWNMFNAEYSFFKDRGAAAGRFPTALDAALDPVPFPPGQFALSPIGMLNEREGLLVLTADGPLNPGSGERQMLGTACAALSAARHREEEGARLRLERSKQTGYSL